MSQLPSPQQLQSLPTSPTLSPLSEKAAAAKTAVEATAMAPLLPLRETIISPVGDILIRLLTPTHTLHYKTSSSVLIITSKIFSAILNPASPLFEAFKSAPYSSTEPFVLDLHDDDPVALCILLKALHNHPSVPRTLTFSQLVRMAVAVDRYDCSHATRSYGDRWMKGWTAKAGKPGHEELLFVAWVWGVQKVFGKLFSRAVVETCAQRVGPGGMDKVPVIKESKGGGGFGEFMPEAVLNAILSDRAQLLTQLKVVFTDLFNRYQPPSPSSYQPLQCAALYPDPCCDALIFSSVYGKLCELNLLPSNTIEELDGFTVNELVGWVLESSAGEGGFKVLSLEKHANECNPLKKLAADVKQAIAEGSKEREVWEFRVQEQDCSWNDIVKEVGITRHS